MKDEVIDILSNIIETNINPSEKLYTFLQLNIIITMIANDMHINNNLQKEIIDFISELCNKNDLEIVKNYFLIINTFNVLNC